MKTPIENKLDDLTAKLDKYIQADEAWKVRAEPVVKAFENSTWLFKISVAALKLLALVGGAVGAYLAIRNFK